MTSTRFDPKPDAPYGSCVTCGEVQATQDDSRVHMSETLKASENGRGHKIRISNPDRQHRIDMHVSRAVEEAIDFAVRDLQDLTDSDDVTSDEMRSALRRYSDFQEAWDEES